MFTILNFFISSFSQLLSSPSFTLLANRSVLNALDHCETSPSPSGSQDDIQPAVEAHLRHVELGPSLRASLTKSSSPRRLALSHSPSNPLSRFIPVPANSPSLTPSNSFPDICEDICAVTSTSFSEAHSACPSSGPSASSTFDLSLIGDYSLDEEPEEFHSFDSTSISSDQTPANFSKGVGLGITGVMKHDGSEFDGVGLVSIRGWIPRSARITHEANSYAFPFQLSESLSEDILEEGVAEISDTFLQEAAMTFIQDPFHIHSLATIPECQSWSELDLDDSETCDSVSLGARDEFETSHASPAFGKGSTAENEAPLGRMKKHFSASTISSELKRTSVSTSARRMHLGGGTRTRSSTWPTQARSWLPQAKPGDGDLRVVN